jgi:hypothetical protein
MVSETQSMATSPQKPALEILCSTVLDGLHATAQPLTILRAGLGDSNLDLMSAVELRDLISTSAIEVERLCTLFHRLQDLVFTESSKPELSLTPILPLLVSAADRDIQLFQAEGMYLQTALPDACPPVLINSARTLQALSQILLIVHSLSHSGDTIELSARYEPSLGVRVEIRNPDAPSARTRAETRLSMALAAAIMRSQRAAVTWTLHPLSAIIDFEEAPAAEHG